MKLNILFEDNDLIVCVKPVNIPSQSDKNNDEDMVTIIKNYIYDSTDISEEPYVAPIHRLDRPVGGIMIFAKNKESAAILSKQQENGEIIKFYQAIVTGELPDESGEFVDYLEKDTKTNMSFISKKENKNAKKAELYYDVVDVFETDDGIFSYVLIELVTGRHHQIRAQMAFHGAGIYLDKKYNKKHIEKKSQKLKTNGEIALFASRIELLHPKTKEKLVFKKEPDTKAFEILDLEEF